jgi:hypothetical protein
VFAEISPAQEIRMAYPDAFALNNSVVNDFLFAGVGEELNGSPLTVLSLLARLGEDPWAQAAKWANSPRAAAIDGLAKAILLMPLAPHALADARATASRLVLLLPARADAPEPKAAVTIGGTQVPEWIPMTAFFCSLAVALMLMTLAPRPDGATTTPNATPAASAQVNGKPAAPRPAPAAPR